MLIDTMKERCVMLDRVTVADGMGGFMLTWTEGAPFDAAVIRDNSMQAREAEKQGVTELYTVTVSKGLPLEFHNVFRRVRDGAVFRVTSNIADSETPKAATFQFGQVSAEKWVLPS